MLDCLILGDSIAVGVGSVSPQCQTIAKVGINSKNYFVNYHTIPSANLTIISLGANDGGSQFVDYLIKLRSKIKHHVIWILPANNVTISKAIIEIAVDYNDVYVKVTNTIDGVHPKSYKSLASSIFEKGL